MKPFAPRVTAVALLALALAAAPLLVSSAAADSITATVPVDINPYGVAVTPDGTTVYVTNAGSSSLSVIDAATNTVIGTIPVGVAPVDVAITPNGATALVSNYFGDTVSVVDLTTDTVVATIPVSSTPYRVAVSPDGTKAYVTHFEFAGSVDVIDVATRTITSTIVVGQWLNDVAFTPDGTKAYVADAIDIIVIDATADSILGTIAGVTATGLVVSPDSSVLYVAGGAIGSLLAIDTISGTVVNTIAVGALPRGVDITADGSKVYVVNDTSSTLSVVDTGTATVTDTIPLGLGPLGVAFSPSGTSAYVTNSGAQTVSVLSVDLLAVLVPQTPVPLANRGAAYSFGTAASLGTPSATFSISAGALPAGLTINPASGVISGTPTVEGVFAFTVTALNAAGPASNDYSITVRAALAPTGVDLPLPLTAAGLLVLAGAFTLASRRLRQVH